MIGTEVMVMCNGTYTLTSPNITNTSAPYNSSENYNTIQCMQMDMYKHQTPYVVEAFVEPWIFAIGLTTNILSFSVLYHMPIVPSLRIVLLTLCVSDSLASVFGFMYIILEVVIFEGNVQYGLWLPGVLEVFTTYKIYLLFTGSSSILIKTGSIIKTHALMNPLRARVQINRRFTIKLVLFIFLTVFVLFLPLSLYIMWKCCFRDKVTQICTNFNQMMPNTIDIKYYFFSIAMVMGPGTIIANIVCFILLKRAIKKSHSKIQKMTDNNSSFVTQNYKIMQAKQGVRINRTFLYGLIVQTLCILPSCVQIVCLLIDPINLVFAENNITIDIIDVVAEISLGILPCYNFWLYLVVNKDFRKTFCLLYTCKASAVKSNQKGFDENSTLFTVVGSIEAGLNAVLTASVVPLSTGESDAKRKTVCKSVRFSDDIETVD